MTQPDMFHNSIAVWYFTNLYFCRSGRRTRQQTKVGIGETDGRKD